LNESLMRYDAELNTPQVPEEFRPVFRFKKSMDLAAATGFFQTASAVQSLGLSISGRQVRKMTGIKEPENDEEAIMPGPSPEEQMQMQMQQGQQPGMRP